MSNIKAVSVEATQVIPTNEISIPNGRAFIVPVRNGKEYPELGFYQSIASAEKNYSDTSKYIIKKKD